MTVDKFAEYKKVAGERAVDFIKSGMTVGLGHGSTAIFAVKKIAALIEAGKLHNIKGIACSKFIHNEALRLNIPLTNLSDNPVIDITIDGADEVDPSLDVIKGGGGALLREKIVAQATKYEIIVIDESKLSPALGTKFRLPVEVVQFNWECQRDFLQSLGATVSIRRNNDNSIFLSDENHFILDSNFGPIEDTHKLSQILNNRIGIVDHGLFLDIAKMVIVAGTNGIQELTRK
jgi:ribose 5-phosphate isomerase A